MSDLGKKYTCYSCHTKFYDLGKPDPLCPKCGADQRDAEEAPAAVPHRGRSRVVAEPVEDEFPAEGDAVASEAEAEGGEEEEDIIPEPEPEPEEAEENHDEDEEEY